MTNVYAHSWRVRRPRPRWTPALAIPDAASREQACQRVPLGHAWQLDARSALPNLFDSSFAFPLELMVRGARIRCVGPRSLLCKISRRIPAIRPQ